MSRFPLIAVLSPYFEDGNKRLVCGFMVFNTTFNNISVLLMKETGGPVENHRPAAGH
jgi:hypothetical protein